MLVLFLHLFLFVRVLLFCNTKRALDGGGHVFVRPVNHAANVPRMLSVPSKLHFLQTRHRFPNWIKMTKQWRVAALLARMRLLQRTNVMTLVMTKYQSASKYYSSSLSTPSEDFHLDCTSAKTE